MTVRIAGVLYELRTEADIHRLFASFSEPFSQPVERPDGGLDVPEPLTGGDLAPEVPHDEVAVALRVANAIRHAVYRPLLSRGATHE